MTFAPGKRAPGADGPLSRIRGWLLGGAVGDALGAAVEFDSLSEIRAAFGADGILDYAPAYGRLGAITDDTQMTLFTAPDRDSAARGTWSRRAPACSSSARA